MVHLLRNTAFHGYIYPKSKLVDHFSGHLEFIPNLILRWMDYKELEPLGESRHFVRDQLTTSSKMVS